MTAGMRTQYDFRVNDRVVITEPTHALAGAHGTVREPPPEVIESTGPWFGHAKLTSSSLGLVVLIWVEIARTQSSLTSEPCEAAAIAAEHLTLTSRPQPTGLVSQQT